MNESYRVNDAIGKFTQWIVLIFQAGAVLVFAASLILGLDWLNDPFIGGLFEQTMVLNGTDTREAGKQWALYEQGFGIGDQLVSVNGVPVSNGEELHHILIASQIGQSVPVEMRTTEGEVQTVDITLQSFPTQDRIAFFVIPMFMSAV